MQQIGRGDHAALFYRNRKEQFAAMVAYVSIGLARNERCFYIAGDNSVRMVLDALSVGGIDVERHTKSGALSVVSVQDSYLKYGAFNSQKMVNELYDEVAKSLELGYSGFRGTGEMLWAARSPETLEELLKYETQLNQQFPSKFVALCQYNEPCFEAELISQVLRLHLKVVARGKLIANPHYDPGTRAVSGKILTVETVFAGLSCC